MRSSFALVLLLVLSACALPQQRSRTFNPYEPLHARITATTTSGPLFHVNRPAYVAMFYIVPGSGVSMLYPGFGSGSLSGRVFAGSHFASYRLGNRQQYFFTGGSYGQPRYYFLIASDRPLNVEQFGAFGDGLLSRLGTSFASYSAYSTMAELARLTLPTFADDGSWTTDLYVDWPSVIYTEPARGRVLLSCGGYEMFVQRGYYEVVRSLMCDRNEGDEVDREEPDPDAEPGAKPVRPGTRDPLPAATGAEGGDEMRTITAAQRAAIRERISASSQLGAVTRGDVTDMGRGESGQVGYGSRARPSPSSGSSSGGGARDASSTSSRPSAPASRPSSTPSASPAPSGGSGGAVSAPSSRPSSSGGGGGEAPSRGRSSPGG